MEFTLIFLLPVFTLGVLVEAWNQSDFSLFLVGIAMGWSWWVDVFRKIEEKDVKLSRVLIRVFSCIVVVAVLKTVFSKEGLALIGGAVKGLAVLAILGYVMYRCMGRKHGKATKSLESAEPPADKSEAEYEVEFDAAFRGLEDEARALSRMGEPVSSKIAQLKRSR